MTKREEIIQAAAELFASVGYRATSYAAIAEKLDMHRNALQHYIPSKPKLAHEVAWAPFKNGAFLAPDVAPAGGAATRGTAAVLSIVRHVGALYVSDVAARASMRLMEERAIIPADLPVPFRPWLEPIAGHLREAIDDGDVDSDVDVDDLAWRIVSSFAGARLVGEMLDEVDAFPEKALRTTEDLLRAHRPHG
ncbi:TetR/AcrR family transcriptional regulator [Microbacterium esteraromaticum]|uniref:TetR/AcrR family transcriptional regulator n=1 Tax=Microbacterium esteraromaticum TaxID=57043 RepID=UPI001C95091E|nr:TetR/AcrR family transcriptional regulator [Microbacterium esteraromaticum]MBY6061012.1 TetR/AcrR family transcriptional regulator [Microbacterium esteraromaticum]